LGILPARLGKVRRLIAEDGQAILEAKHLGWGYEQGCGGAFSVLWQGGADGLTSEKLV
jgi:hypothetical protein